MKIVKLSQTEDRESWLDARRGLITGSKAGKVKPLTRGTDRTPVGFWELLAERLAIEKDGEPERDRGLRLENEGLTKTAKLYNLDLDLDPGMWVSDKSKDIAVSPDSAERSNKPTYAAEAKCLDSKNHLKIMVMDKRAQKTEDYRPFDSIPKEYKDQVTQYFVVNEHLKTLYFTLYDDRFAFDELTHYVIVVDREDIKEEIELLETVELDIIKDIKTLIKELTNGQRKTLC